jgi:hypothetical protein
MNYHILESQRQNNKLPGMVVDDKYDENNPSLMDDNETFPSLTSAAILVQACVISARPP